MIDIEKIVIRPEKKADIPAIRVVEEQAFGRATEAGLVSLCRKRGRISLSLVALQHGQVVGHLLFTPLQLEPQQNQLRGLGLGPVAVLPVCQRLGIGAKLIRTGLEMCREQGWDFVVLLGDPAYYGRFGFRAARELGLTGDYGAGDEFQALELVPGALEGVTGKVSYIPEFAETGC